MSKGCSKCGTQIPGDARFCGHCGASLEAPRGAAPVPPGRSRRPSALSLALGAAVFVLAACGAWWLNAPRTVATPSFDAAPPPSMLAASVAAAPAAPASMPVDDAARRMPSIAATAASAVAPPPANDLWEAADRGAATDAALTATARRMARVTADRDARPRALREQRAGAAMRADADAARLRLEEARGRGLPTAEARRSAPSPSPSPAPTRSVQERCVNNLNSLTKAICEARECVHAEHAGEPVCQRIRAADDRRREQ